MSTVPALISRNVGNTLTNFTTWGSLVFNVKAFKAKGDYNPDTGLGTDDTDAIRAAYNEAKLVYGTVFFPPGNYLVSDTTIIDIPVVIEGRIVFGSGSAIYTNTNKPIFLVTSAVLIDGIAFHGDNDPVKTLQDGIFAVNTNSVYIRNCFFFRLTNGIHIKDTVFYSAIESCTFFSATNAFIYGEGTTNPGYQITINHCICPVNGSKYGFYFQNAGTVTIDDLEMSPTNCTDAAIVFESISANGGLQQISHSRIEGSLICGLKLIGTALNPIKNIHVSNTYIAGDPSVSVDYGTGLSFENCFFTGSGGGAAGRNALSVKYQGDNIKQTDCAYQVTNVAITADLACTSISLDITNPTFGGGLPFIYLPFLSPAYIKRISVFGGTVGVAATPLDIGNYNPDKIRVNVAGLYLSENWIVPIMDTGWSNFGAPYSTVAYKKDSNGWVHFKGFIKYSGTVGAGTFIFQVPAGYRPGEYIVRPTLSSNAGTAVPCVIEVQSIGAVVNGAISAGGTWLCLDGISYLAEN